MDTQEIISSDCIVSLLPEYRALQNYTNRLSFWERYNLTDDLCYYACEFTDDEAGYKKRKAFGYRLWGCQTWQETLQYNFMTIAPFTDIEAHQFVEWGLSIRRQKLSELNVEHRKSEFYKSFEKAPRRGKLLSARNEGAQKWADNLVSDDTAVRRNLLGAYELDELTYSQFVRAFDLDVTIDLAAYVPIKQPFFSWEIIDTYLTAESNCLHAGFLEDLKRRYDRGEEIIIPPASIIDAANNESKSPIQPNDFVILQASDERNLDQRHQILIHFYEGGKMLERKHKNYNKYIIFSTSRKRLAYPNESQSKLKHLINDIEKVIPLLSNKGRQDAELELNTLKRRQITEN